MSELNGYSENIGVRAEENWGFLHKGVVNAMPRELRDRVRRRRKQAHFREIRRAYQYYTHSPLFRETTKNLPGGVIAKSVDVHNIGAFSVPNDRDVETDVIETLEKVTAPEYEKSKRVALKRKRTQLLRLTAAATASLYFLFTIAGIWSDAWGAFAGFVAVSLLSLYLAWNNISDYYLARILIFLGGNGTNDYSPNNAENVKLLKKWRKLFYQEMAELGYVKTHSKIDDTLIKQTYAVLSKYHVNNTTDERVLNEAFKTRCEAARGPHGNKLNLLDIKLTRSNPSVHFEVSNPDSEAVQVYRDAVNAVLNEDHHYAEALIKLLTERQTAYALQIAKRAKETARIEQAREEQERAAKEKEAYRRAKQRIETGDVQDVVRNRSTQTRSSELGS